MTTIMLELVRAFPRTATHDKILYKCGLGKLAYVRSIQLDLLLLIAFVE